MQRRFLKLWPLSFLLSSTSFANHSQAILPDNIAKKIKTQLLLAIDNKIKTEFIRLEEETYEKASISGFSSKLISAGITYTPYAMKSTPGCSGVKMYFTKNGDRVKNIPTVYWNCTQHGHPSDLKNIEKESDFTGKSF